MYGNTRAKKKGKKKEKKRKEKPGSLARSSKKAFGQVIWKDKYGSSITGLGSLNGPIDFSLDPESIW
jgi:hypothetical protein